MKSTEINKFWEWFHNYSSHLNPKNISQEYIEVLDKKICLLGDFPWEIGFDSRVNKNFLVISPEGDKDLLVQAKAIINQAPKTDDWIFYP